MPTIFIEPTDTSDWTSEQRLTSEAFFPVLKEYLTAQMQNQEACDRFWDAQQAAIRARHVPRSEWQTGVRIPVVESLGYRFEGPDAGVKYSALYHLLGAPTCVHWSFPASRPDSPAVARGIENETRQLADYLVALRLQQKDLDSLLALIRGK